MNFDISTIFGTISGLSQTALGFIFNGLGVSSETGNGLLSFVRFFEVIGVFFANLITKISSGLAG